MTSATASTSRSKAKQSPRQATTLEQQQTSVTASGYQPRHRPHVLDLTVDQALALKQVPMNRTLLVDGVDPLLAAMRLYASPLRRPNDDHTFVALVQLSARLRRLLHFLTSQSGGSEADYEDLYQHVVTSLWQTSTLKHTRVSSESLFFQYVFQMARNYLARQYQTSDALPRAHRLDADPQHDWHDSPVFGDDGSSSEAIEDALDHERRANDLKSYVSAARAHLDTALKPYSQEVYDPGPHSEIARQLTQAEGFYADLARQEIAAFDISAQLRRSNKATTKPQAKQPRKLGRPPGPSNVALRRSKNQERLHRLYQLSMLRPADYAVAIGTSPAMLNKYLCAAIEPPADVLARAREYAKATSEHTRELRTLYKQPMSAIIERWSMTIAGRPLGTTELAEILGYNVTTTRRWRDNSGKPAVTRLAQLELKLRQHFGKPH